MPASVDHTGDMPREPLRSEPRRRLFHGLRRWSRSRTVSLLKIVLPLVALSLIALVVLWSHLQQVDPGFRVGFSSAGTEDARNLLMTNARYAGRNRSKQPYLVTAESALQDYSGADVIHLTQPKGDMTMTSGAWVALTAPVGTYRQQSQKLDLSGGVSLFHDSGLEFTSETAHIDLKDSTAVGHDPVTGHGPTADITSQGFRVLEDGDRVIFTGKAHLTLRRSAKPAAKTRGTNR